MRALTERLAGRLVRVFGVLVLCTVATSAVASDAEDLAKMLDDFLWGASIGSAEAHKRFWADELVYTSSNGTRTDKTTIVAGMDATATLADGETPDVIYSAEDVEIDIYGETAIVAFRLIGTPQASDSDAQEYFNTGTFLKRDGVWNVVAWQATRIPSAVADD